MKFWRFLWRMMATSLLAAIITGCQGLVGSAGNSPDVQLTPSTTPDGLGYVSVGSHACLLADWGSIQTDRPQGDLIAWSPDSTQLAYLAPQSSTGWFVGLTSLAQGASFEQQSTLVPNIMAVGDLTWSPDGAWLAFIALRNDESLQTVMAVRADGSQLIDGFPLDEARSDLRTSQKSILAWRDATNLRVLSTCDEDCQQAYNLNITNGSIQPAGNAERLGAADATLTPDIVKVLDGLQPQSNLRSFEPNEYPKAFNQPNWSPDGQQVLYLDRRGLLWNLTPATKIQYLLDIGLRDVDETKWSPDGRKVAVRAEDRIFVFDLLCSAPQPSSTRSENAPINP